MERSLVQQLSLTTFTPSAMPHDVLEGIFVQREALLQQVVTDLAASVPGARQYLLLVGARGMGKTHFVSLVYHRLVQKCQKNSDLKEGLLIAWLREEEYGVNSWLYLVVEILRSLTAEGIDTTGAIAQLTGTSIAEAEYLANRVLLEVIGSRTLLIITENFDKVLAGLGEKEQFKMRSFLQENNCCSILATTPKISADTSSRNRPFFGFFSRIDLWPFSYEDAIAMLQKIAERTGNDKLVAFLATPTGVARVKAVHYLAGGNPRVYALFAPLVTEETLDDLLPAVMEMLDKLTPFFQSQVESLGQSDDQQKIVMYLVRARRSVPVKEIATQCFISSERTTSTALKKLREKGFVTATQQGREVFYDLAEGLMGMCLQMKSVRNSLLMPCVEFIRVWFTVQQQREQEERLLAEGTLEQAEYFQVALSSPLPAPVMSLYMRDLQGSLEDGDDGAALQAWQELAELHEVELIDRQRVAEFISAKKFGNAWAAIQDYLKTWSVTAESLYLEGLMLCDQEKYAEALEKFDQCLKQDPKNFQAWWQQGECLGKLRRYEEAITSYDHVIKIKPDSYHVWSQRGNTLDDLGRGGEAITSYDRAIEIKPDRYEAWYNRGLVLGKMWKYEEAITSYDRVIEIKPNDHEAWYYRGLNLAHLSRYKEAIASYDRAIEIKPDGDKAWYDRGYDLCNLGQYEEAITSYDHVIKIKPDNHKAWYYRGISLEHLSRYKEAITSYDCAIEIKPDKDEAWHSRGITLRRLGRYEEAISSYDRALELKPKDDITLRARSFAISLWIRRLHDEGLVDFNQSNYLQALEHWKKTFTLTPQQKSINASDLIQEFLDEQLLPKFQQPTVQAILPDILALYVSNQLLLELGVALINNLKAIQSPTISDHTATEWLNLWQTLGANHPEMTLTLQMLAAGIAYKKNPQDSRPFLSIPQEMRPILREALGLPPHISQK